MFSRRTVRVSHGAGQLLELQRAKQSASGLHERARQSDDASILRMLSTKRLAENASQKIFTYNQRSRAFSATPFTDEKSQIGEFTGEVMGKGSRRRHVPFHRRLHPLALPSTQASESSQQ